MTILQFIVCIAAGLIAGGVIGFVLGVRQCAKEALEHFNSYKPFDVFDVCEEKEKE